MTQSLAGISPAAAQVLSPWTNFTHLQRALREELWAALRAATYAGRPSMGAGHPLACLHAEDSPIRDGVMLQLDEAIRDQVLSRLSAGFLNLLVCADLESIVDQVLAHDWPNFWSHTPSKQLVRYLAVQRLGDYMSALGTARNQTQFVWAAESAVSSPLAMMPAGQTQSRSVSKVIGDQGLRAGILRQLLVNPGTAQRQIVLDAVRIGGRVALTMIGPEVALPSEGALRAMENLFEAGQRQEPALARQLAQITLDEGRRWGAQLWPDAPEFARA